MKRPIERGECMGWQAGDGSRPGEVPGPGEWLPELLAGFEHGGAWGAAAPSAALAAALEVAAGPEGLYEGADTGALVGIVRQWAAIESWAAAGILAALRAMMREDSDGRPLLRRRGDLPDGWDDSLNYEVAAALAMGPVSAGNLATLAWTLGVRLPGVGRLLAGGILTRAKAKLIAATFEPLDEGEAARAEALILPEVAGKTYFQVERLAWRAALAVAPDVAERRRAKAERERARVTVFREESGAVGLSGRDLPAAQALAGHASVVARAGQYEASGAFGGQSTSGLQALAYLHLLNGVSARDAIAFARAATAEPPAGGDGGHEEGGHGEDAGDEGPRGEAGRPAGAPGGSGDSRSHGDDQGPDDDGEDPGDDEDPGGGEGPGDGDGPGGDEGPGGGEEPGNGGGPGSGGGRLVLPEVTVPLATLLGLAGRAGDSRLLGALDPAMARDLAAAAARFPSSRWEVTVVDDHGYAVGHGIARPRRGKQQGRRQRPQDPACGALPARVNITVTETLLRQLAAQRAQPRSGAPPGDWELIPRTAGGWALALPGGRELTVRFDVVPTHDCDHRYQVNTYEPGDRLRRLVQARDHECTFPPCSRPARDSDFEHAIPYDQGGATDACNAGARSRRCHQVKQSKGWSVTQPKPGWHVWTTPTGRTYIQEPWRYIALAVFIAPCWVCVMRPAS
jgi:hypothetical protein